MAWARSTEILLERRQRLTSREPAAMSVAGTSQATAETRRVHEQFLLNARFLASTCCVCAQNNSESCDGIWMTLSLWDGPA